MSSQNEPVEVLERRAAEQRQRLTQDVASLQDDVRRELDVRGRLAEGIHSNPRRFYGAAAGAALFTGYLFARILKA